MNNSCRVDEEALGLPFDQYQRYRLVADLVRSVATERLRILDVGGRTALLRRFLPEHEIVLVDRKSSEEDGLVLGDGSRLPFRDDAFDLVCSFDTLEHVPTHRRSEFVDECARVARRWIALAGPYADAEVAESEALLRGVLAGMGVRNVHLEEHARHGLPERPRVEERLRAAGAEHATFAHGNLSLWLPAMAIALYMDVEPTLRDAARDVHRFINRELYDSDHGGRTYRHVVFGALGGAPLPEAPPLASPASVEVAPARKLVEYVAELGLIERSRATWSAEREQWQRDLARWRRERDELARENADLSSDLAGHQASLGATQSELDTCRRDLHRQQVEREEALAAADRAQHEAAALRLVRDELRAALRDHEAIRDELLTEVQGAREHTRALEGELASHKQVVATVEADLAGHRESVRVLQEEKARLEADGRALQLELDRRTRELDAVRTDREQLRATSSAELEESGRVVASLSSELEAFARQRDELMAELESVREEARRSIASEASLHARLTELNDQLAVYQRSLRSRFGNLRRVLDPRKPRLPRLAGPEGPGSLRARGA